MQILRLNSCEGATDFVDPIFLSAIFNTRRFFQYKKTQVVDFISTQEDASTTLRSRIAVAPR